MIFRKNKYKKITVGRLTQFCTFMTIPYYVVQEHDCTLQQHVPKFVININ